jgi:hypothetical protein
LFIHPAPSFDVTDWLVVEALHTLADLATWGAEDTIFPWNSHLRTYHYVIVLGAIPWMLQHRKSLWENEMLLAEQRFERAFEKMIRQLNKRYASQVQWDLPVMSKWQQ